MNARWSDDVYESLRKSLEIGRFCDIILKGVGFKFRAHKVILSCTCSYFDQLFEEENEDIGSLKSIVYLPDFTTGEVALMLRFAYYGEVIYTGENGAMFEKTAKRFGFRQFQSGSIEPVKLYFCCCKDSIMM